MALPSALQQRLLKRGLLQQQQQHDSSKKSSEQVEEVFAESYDTPTDKFKDTKGIASELGKIPDCPNRSNNFHQCSDYCVQKYGYKKFEPHPVMERRRLRMLKIYPLYPPWVEVPDIESNRYYYWNTENDLVCWLSPSCPKAKFETSAKATKTITEPVKRPLDSTQYHAKPPSTTSYKNTQAPKPPSSGHNSNKRPKALDPMDPASYSDIPRGTWADGLKDSRDD